MTKAKPRTWPPAVQVAPGQWTATDHHGYRFTADTQAEAEQMRKDYNS